MLEDLEEEKLTYIQDGTAPRHPRKNTHNKINRITECNNRKTLDCGTICNTQCIVQDAENKKQSSDLSKITFLLAPKILDQVVKKRKIQ